MTLSSQEIRERVQNNSGGNSESGLVITPVLDWDSQAKEGECSIDVRLGQRFRLPGRTKLDGLDHLSSSHREDVERYNEDHHVPLGDYFVLHPRQFVLGGTLEWIRLPADLSAYVVGRSSWGRDGLIVATAIGIHPNYSGIITLELTNIGEIPIRLYPGSSIAQLFIHEVDSDTDPDSVSLSSFHASVAPASGNPLGDDREVLEKLKEDS